MLTSLALILIVGLLSGALLKKLKLPSLIGMLLTGIVLGPYVLNMLDESILLISADLREIALIIILTRAGLSLDFDDLKAIGRPAMMMSFIPACFEMAGTILISYFLFDLPLLDAAMLAAIVASASPAVIIPRMLKLMDTGYGTDKKIPQLILAGDSIDDIFNIVVFSSLLALSGGKEVTMMSFLDVPISIVTGIFVGIMVGILLVGVFKKLLIDATTKVIIMLGTAFLLMGLEENLGNWVAFSGLLAIMTSGVTILRKQPDVANQLSTRFAKLWLGAQVILFALVGATVNIHYVTTSIFKTIFMLIIVLIIRGIGILMCLIGTNLNKKERLFCMLTGIPKATVQAAIGGIPLAMGLPNGGIMLVVAVIAILFTAPVGAFILDSTYKQLLVKSQQ